jgi:hypothetical protein
MTDQDMTDRLTRLTSQWRKRAARLIRNPDGPAADFTLAAELKALADQVDAITGAIAHALPGRSPERIWLEQDGDPAGQAQRDAQMHLACGECGVEASGDGTPPRPEDHFAWCSRYGHRPMPWLPAHSPSWEVAYGPVDTVIEAHSAEQAATLSAAERDVEARQDRYAEPDPNPRVWVRQMGAAGTDGSWQQVYLDPAAIETAAAAIRAILAEEYGEDEAPAEPSPPEWS